MSDEDRDAEHQLKDLENVWRYVETRLAPLRPAYAQSLTGLWLGNGGGALAVLSFIGATWQDGAVPHALLFPLWCFVLGLIAMGIGTGAYLWTEWIEIRSMENAKSPMDFTIGSVKRPLERAGLTPSDARTVMAIPSAVFFVLGCLSGLIVLT